MPSEKQYQERKENISAILQLLRFRGKHSRRQIADALNLSWGCVSELVWILLSQNILLEEKERASGKGRCPGALSLNPNICFLGIDINRNGLMACICDLLGRKISTHSTALRYRSKEEFLSCVCDFANSIIDAHSNLFGIGFAMQGIYGKDSGLWEFPSVPPIYIDFEKDLKPRFDLPCIIDHDPNCILYGHFDHTDQRKMILRLDEGIGAAIHSGNGFEREHLLEIEYLVVNAEGMRLRDIVSLHAVHEACGREFDSRHPDDHAIQFFETMGKYLGIALGNLCNLLTLHEILLCGDLTAYYPLFSQAMLTYYKKTALSVQQANITVIPINDAAFGAAKMAMDRFQY